jgi:hypothetical protein
MMLSVVPSGLAAFSATNVAAGETISASGSADSAAMIGAVAAAVGPVGAVYLEAYVPAQANNLAATMLVGGVHAAIGQATQVSEATYVAMDDM